ncbi:amidohydrolase [Candidatus Woesearchaeota archaeon]|nr:MAG: amidohydrolase [Candidatus Woesearchaeota archaeon]
MSILVKNIFLNNKKRDVYIDDNSFTEISENISVEAEFKIDAKNKAILPSFFNSHTHAAMSLLKGFADDFSLNDWLAKVWPVEQKFKEKGVYVGTKLAVLEMIKSGTTFFNDMYWFPEQVAKAAEELGVRACVASAFVDGMPFPRLPKDSELVKFAYGPHAIYTVSKENLLKFKDLVEEDGRLIHIHLSETRKEVDDSLKNFNLRPVEYLDSFNFLDKNVIAAHGVWFDDNEINILTRTKPTIVYNPVSNAKLASGVLRFRDLVKSGVRVLLGTDGNASNNNLDMFEEMKFAALLQKVCNLSPCLLPASQVYSMATQKAAEFFGVNAGRIEEGRLADFILVDLKNINLFPCYDLISNVVYSARGDCVTHTVCNGRILMSDRKVDGEEKILEEVREFIEKIF